LRIEFQSKTETLVTETIENEMTKIKKSNLGILCTSEIRLSLEKQKNMIKQKKVCVIQKTKNMNAINKEVEWQDMTSFLIRRKMMNTMIMNWIGSCFRDLRNRTLLALELVLAVKQNY
jgi:hypothetical protein